MSAADALSAAQARPRRENAMSGVQRFEPASSPQQPVALPLEPKNGGGLSGSSSSTALVVRGGEHPPQEAADQGPPSQRLRSCVTNDRNVSGSGSSTALVVYSPAPASSHMAGAEAPSSVPEEQLRIQEGGGIQQNAGTPPAPAAEADPESKAVYEEMERLISTRCLVPSELHGWRLSVTVRPRDQRVDICALRLSSGEKVYSRPQLLRALRLSTKDVLEASSRVKGRAALVPYTPPRKRAMPTATSSNTPAKRKRKAVRDEPMGGEGDASGASSSSCDCDLDGLGVACSVCGEQEDEEGNEILLCDGHGCSAGYHQRCLEPALEAVPEREWLCPECEARGQSHFVERILSHSGDGARRLYRVRIVIPKLPSLDRVCGSAPLLPLAC